MHDALLFAPVWSRYVPAPQGVHVELPFNAAYEPRGQSEHAAAEEAPGVDRNRPTGQGVHLAAPEVVE